MRQVLLAFQFLTIVPVRVPSGEITEREIAGSAAFFPLVGACQGLAVGISSFVLIKFLPPDIVAAIAVALFVAANGGFDLDGLADTADSLAVKSSGDPQRDRIKRLAVMKDSTTGAVGVVVLVITMLLKFVLLRRFLGDFPASTACAVFFETSLLSKWITVPAMYHAVSARADGLGKLFIEHTTAGNFAIATILAAALSAGLFLLDYFKLRLTGSIEIIVILFVGFYLIARFAAHFFLSRFGGMTGDHFGALTEISETISLISIYAWLRHFTL